MVLLGGAAWLFILATPEGRRWLKRPHLYLATGLALALFSPVIIWNATHEWASFYFQGVGRHEGFYNFGLQDLIGSALVLITPLGLLSLVRLSLAPTRFLGRRTGAGQQKGLLLMAVLTLVPLSVFFVHSLFRMSKLNWTAPIWLGAFPFLALICDPIGRQAREQGGGRRMFPRLWPATTAVLLVSYAALLHYLTIGIPGLPYPQNSLDIGKRSLARQVHAILEDYRSNTGRRPVVVCWDAERMPSWVAYYLARQARAHSPAGMADAVENTSGAHLFGADTKMFCLWHPLNRFRDRPVMLIGERRWKLEYPPVLSRARPLSDVRALTAAQTGKPSRTYFYRFLEPLRHNFGLKRGSELRPKVSGHANGAPRQQHDCPGKGGDCHAT
jgi:dolichol-phosphate mannosyltransferase